MVPVTNRSPRVATTRRNARTHDMGKVCYKEGHMETYAFVLGSHPALSAVEIFCAARRRGINASFDISALPALLLMTPAVALDAGSFLRGLGGTPYVTRLKGVIPELTPEAIVSHFPFLVDGSVGPKTIGLSAHTTSQSPDLSAHDLRALGMGIKRMLRTRGVRMLLPKHGLTLTSAQLFHAGIPGNGLMMFLCRIKGSWHVGALEAVQDLRRYALKDRGRPAVDPGHGMMPPKLAQMFLNISLLSDRGTVLDPFCGSGTIPLEALLLGHSVIASDVSAKQVQRTRKNLQWAQDVFRDELPPTARYQTFTHDIMQHVPNLPARSVDAIVTEGWLGPARTRPPTPLEAERTFQRAQEQLLKLLGHVGTMLKSSGTVVIAIPAFRVGQRILHAPFLASLARHFPSRSFVLEPLVPETWDHEIFRTGQQGTLLYGRPDAIVLREIVRFRNTTRR